MFFGYPIPPPSLRPPGCLCFVFRRYFIPYVRALLPVMWEGEGGCALGILLQFLFEREKPSYLLVGKKGKQAKVGSFSLYSFLFSPSFF